MVACGRNTALEIIDEAKLQKRCKDGHESPRSTANVFFGLWIHFIVVHDYVPIPISIRLHQLVPQNFSLFCCYELPQGIQRLETSVGLLAAFENEGWNSDIDAVAYVKGLV